MSSWKFIQPKAITNLCDNPSFETNTTGWSTGGTNTIAQSSIQQKFGLYSLLCTQIDSPVLPSFAYTFPAAGTYTVSCWIYVNAGWTGGEIRIQPVNYTGSTNTYTVVWETTDCINDWHKLETQIVVVSGDLVGDVRVRAPDALVIAGSIYMDGFQIEAGDTVTTYCDGDQEGCEWNGVAHASTSTRSGESRAGGIVKDFKTDYGFGQAEYLGTGMPPTAVSIDSYALLPGGELNNIKNQSRPFSLVGTLKGSNCDCNINVARRELVEELSHNTYPKDYDGWQPVKIRYETVKWTDSEVYHLEFDAAAANVNCGSDVALDNLVDTEFTAEAWIRADGYGGGVLNDGRIFDKTENFTVGWLLETKSQGTPAQGIQAYAYCVGADAWSIIGTDDFTADGEWHHVAAYFNQAGTRQFFIAIDGVWVTTYISQIAGGGAATSDAARDFSIGNIGTNLNKGFDGGIGWCRLSDFDRYSHGSNFTPPERCILPPIDANTIAQWIGAEDAGNIIDNQEGTAALDGTQTDCIFADDCDGFCCAETREIEAHYEQGLEAAILLENRIHEKLALRFIAPDPMWYEIGDSASELDTRQFVATRYITGRLKTTGLWDDLGITANPATNGSIYAIAYSPIENVYYVGGLFTNMNGSVGRDNFARYDPNTDTWSTVGGAAAVSGEVDAIAIAPNGDVYVGGSFLNLGGANGDYVAYWDISGSVWLPLAAGGTASVRALAFGLDGTLYIGGTFVNWNGVANADHIISWDGAAYGTLGTGANLSVLALDIASDGTLYAGGAATTWGGVASDYIAQWDGTTWAVVGTATSVNGTVYGLDTARDGTLYVAGNFTSPGNYSAKWNGAAWSSLGSGLDATVRSVKVAPDDIVYFGGAFTNAGGLARAEGVAKWNGASWAMLDIFLPGNPTIYAIETGPQDPVIAANYDVYVGFDTTGNAQSANTNILTHDGTASSFPKFVLGQVGFTYFHIIQIRNETTGKELSLDYSPLSGEEITIDLTPTEKSVTSSFFGLKFNVLLANSDTGEFVLQPGDNNITVFIYEGAGLTSTRYSIWKDTYKSFD